MYLCNKVTLVEVLCALWWYLEVIARQNFVPEAPSQYKTVFFLLLTFGLHMIERVLVLSPLKPIFFLMVLEVSLILRNVKSWKNAPFKTSHFLALKRLSWASKFAFFPLLTHFCARRQLFVRANLSLSSNFLDFPLLEGSKINWTSSLSPFACPGHIKVQRWIFHKCSQRER